MPTSAIDLARLQTCPRLYCIEGSRSSDRKPRPSRLFEDCLKTAIIDMSAGKSYDSALSEATANFIEVCARPGLNVARDAFTIAHDWISILATSLSAINVRPGEYQRGPRTVTPKWECGALLSGVELHRWVTLQKFTNESVVSELESWHTVGDICATGLPMVVHFIEVGSTRGGHQHSHWCRSFEHEHIRGRYAFQKSDGTPLEGKWKPIWYQDRERDPRAWLEMMRRDGVKLIHDVRVKVPTEEQRSRFLRDLAAENARAAALGPLESIPVYRPACNVHGPCQWKWICY